MQRNWINVFSIYGAGFSSCEFMIPVEFEAIWEFISNTTERRYFLLFIRERAIAFEREIDRTGLLAFDKNHGITAKKHDCHRAIPSLSLRNRRERTIKRLPPNYAGPRPDETRRWDIPFSPLAKSNCR